MATIFSTKKREANASKLESAFETGVAQANEKSRWKSFIESKPVQSICRGSQAFGRFVAAKTKAAAQWTGTKLKDAGHDFGQGAKAFGHSFADSYRTRQEEKRTAKFINGCEERGFVVMSQEEFQNAHKSMSDMYKALYSSGPSSADDIFTYANADESISKMRDRIVHFNATNGINESATAIQNTVEYPAAAKTLADAYPETQEFLASKFDPAKAKELADEMGGKEIHLEYSTAAKTEPKSKSDTSALTDDELKSAKTVFEYDYEHNDGDQIWDDTCSYKVHTETGSFVKVSTNGWNGDTTVKKVTADEFNKDLARVNEEIACQDSLRAHGHYVRGGYSITSKFTDEDKALVDEVTSPAAEMKDNIQDSTENGTKSVKFSEQLNLVKESLELRCQYIQNAFQRMAQAENEEQRTQIASDCMQQLRNDLSGISNAIKEQKDAIENPVTEDKGRGNEFDFAEADSTEAQQGLGV